jgi:hypothetical protein
MRKPRHQSGRSARRRGPNAPLVPRHLKLQHRRPHLLRGQQPDQRGLRILEHLEAVTSPQSVMDVAIAIDLHRSITYRLLRTLETHELVASDPASRHWLGVGVSALARSARSDLQTAAMPRLDALADRSR